MIVVLSMAVIGVVLAAWTPLRRSRFALAIGLCLTVVGLLTVLAGEPRWMVVPLTAAVALAAVTAALRVRTGPAGRPGSIGRAAAAGAASTVAAAAAALAGGAAWALPTLELPPPTGSRAVGTSVMQWDPGRPKVLSDDPTDTRVLVAQLLYPTEATGPGRAYLENWAVPDAIAGQAGLPGFLLDGALRGRTNAVTDAPRAQEAFPLVLFSPGLGGVRNQNSAWAEDLASHGYVVAAVDHPYDSAAVVLEDGTVIRSTLAATGDDEEDQRVADELASIRADDLIATLDHLDHLDHLDPGLTAHGVATAGHSIGGAAAILAATRDGRVDAVVNLDGLPRGGRRLVPVLAVVAGAGTGSPEGDARYDAALTNVLAACGTQSPRSDVPGYGCAAPSNGSGHGRRARPRCRCRSMRKTDRCTGSDLRSRDEPGPPGHKGGTSRRPSRGALASAPTRGPGPGAGSAAGSDR